MKNEWVSVNYAKPYDGVSVIAGIIFPTGLTATELLYWDDRDECWYIIGSFNKDGYSIPLADTYKVVCWKNIDQDFPEVFK